MIHGIYRILWAILSLICTLYDILSMCARKLKAFYLESYDLAKNRRSVSYEIEYLEQCKPELTKIPKHLTIIVGHEDDASADMLTKIAVYALIMDIEYISFYDTRGHFNFDQVQVPKFVSSKKLQNGRFLWSMPGGRRKSGQLNCRNGMEKSIEVVLLSSHECKPLIIEVCKDLFEKRHTEEVQEALKNRNSLMDKISELVSKKLYHLPDPDCAIVLSRFICTYGLMPWNTGFTEFHLIETGSYFNVRVFADVLYKFSKCEQRFGR